MEQQSNYRAYDARYDRMQYRRCGKSGVLLPAVSFGLWQNFGLEKALEEQKKLIFRAFDLGITHFDLANNYGAPANGMAEENFGRILKEDLNSYRDELFISTKAGYEMWKGPYGNRGSRKYLTASLDQSLQRMGLEYVDVFYHHRPDPETPLEETMEALSDLVRRGKALYVGISNYKKEDAVRAIKILRENKTPCLLNQIRYNMLERWPEEGLLPVLEESGTGCICFSPLAQGTLTDKYLGGVPDSSRAQRPGTSIGERYLKTDILKKVGLLNRLAAERGQSLAQMALCWVLRRREVTSVLIGASRVSQLEDNMKALGGAPFSMEEQVRIDEILR